MTRLVYVIVLSLGLLGWLIFAQPFDLSRVSGLTAADNAYGYTRSLVHLVTGIGVFLALCAPAMVRWPSSKKDPA